MSVQHWSSQTPVLGRLGEVSQRASKALRQARIFLLIVLQSVFENERRCRQSDDDTSHEGLVVIRCAES